MSARLKQVIAAIDAANAADPSGAAGAEPPALLYGQRMSAELARVVPDASEPLALAARGQHIERWIIPRDSYPAGRTGYLNWRTALARHHAARVTGLMAEAGYAAEDQERAARMLRKEGLKRDPEVQALEDVICLVFLRWYAGDFLASREGDDAMRIVAKTARKMSPEGRARVVAEFDLPEALAAPFREGAV